MPRASREPQSYVQRRYHALQDHVQPQTSNLPPRDTVVWPIHVRLTQCGAGQRLPDRLSVCRAQQELPSLSEPSTQTPLSSIRTPVLSMNLLTVN